MSRYFFVLSIFLASCAGAPSQLLDLNKVKEGVGRVVKQELKVQRNQLLKEMDFQKQEIGATVGAAARAQARELAAVKAELAKKPQQVVRRVQAKAQDRTDEVIAAVQSSTRGAVQTALDIATDQQKATQAALVASVRDQLGQLEDNIARLALRKVEESVSPELAIGGGAAGAIFFIIIGIAIERKLLRHIV